MKTLVCCLLALGFASCKETFTPKPKGYFRIDYPEKKYTTFQSPCGFSFESPVYSKVEPDTERGAEPCWYNVQYPDFNATLHFSFKDLGNKKNELFGLIEDAHSLVFKHTQMADEIIQEPILNTHGASGMVYELTGNAASQVQFYLTDSTRHFVRGALYFNAQTNEDSLSEVLVFIKKDLIRMVNSMSFQPAQ